MTEIRRADPSIQRRAVLLLIVSAILGTVLVLGFEHYRGPLRDWLVSEPRDLARRLTLFFLLATALVSIPLLACGTYLWSLADKVQAARMFPPPGFRAIRDTPVVEGPAAVLRGRILRVVALGLGVASVLLCLLLWELARALREG
jgi:hypothetical protein